MLFVVSWIFDFINQCSRKVEVRKIRLTISIKQCDITRNGVVTALFARVKRTVSCSWANIQPIERFWCAGL